MMKSTATRVGYCAAATILLLLLLTVSAGADTQDATTHSAKTLAGEYFWTQNETRGPVEATFTPESDGVWAVKFEFEFDGKQHVYQGTARGSLDEGALEGEVRNREDRVTFTFEGTFEDGTFQGTHASMRGGSPTQTGTILLAS